MKRLCTREIYIYKHVLSSSVVTPAHNHPIGWTYLRKMLSYAPNSTHPPSSPAATPRRILVKNLLRGLREGISRSLDPISISTSAELGRSRRQSTASINIPPSRRESGRTLSKNNESVNVRVYLPVTSVDGRTSGVTLVTHVIIAVTKLGSQSGRSGNRGRHWVTATRSTISVYQSAVQLGWVTPLWYTSSRCPRHSTTRVWPPLSPDCTLMRRNCSPLRRRTQVCSTAHDCSQRVTTDSVGTSNSGA